jgi:radical SAM superfamily enzyme YgiQ (UPF0313 family)
VSAVVHSPYSLHGHGEPEPIGLEYVASALAANGFDCAVRSPSELSVGLSASPRRLSFLSAITSEYPGVVAAATDAQNRGDTTVLGGYHACGSPNEATAGPFDYVVVGEGEEIAVAIARAVLLGEESALAAYRSGSTTSPKLLSAQRLTDLDAIAFPSRSADRLGGYMIYDLMWPTASHQRNTAIVLTARGCMHDCDFCASSTIWGCGVRCRSYGNILRELRDIKYRFGTNTVVIIDQSFGQDREWTLGLCKAIREADLDMSWYHQSNLTIDRDLIAAMADAGCTKIGFGLEGLSPSAVERIKPPNPTSFDAINDLFDYCTGLGLFVKAYTMIGFPWETEDTVREYMRWVPELRASQIKISYMTPFPGTGYWTKYKDQLVTRDWENFDTVRMPVVHNPHISVERYHAIRNELFLAFYGSGTYTEGVRRMIAKHPRTEESYREFAGFLDSFGLIHGHEPWLRDVGYVARPGSIYTSPH